MNEIKRLYAEVTKRFPEVAATLNAPADRDAAWFLEIERFNDTPILVEWRSDRGFGVSTPTDDDYGTGPDEIYPSAKEAFERVVQLVESGDQTRPPETKGGADSGTDQPG